MRWLHVSGSPRRFKTLATLVSGSMLGGLLVAGAFGVGSAQAVAYVPTLEPFAGNGLYGPSNPIAGPKSTVSIPYPTALATDALGDVFVVNHDDFLLRKIDSAGNLTVIAGNGMNTAATPGPATASAIGYITQIAATPGGDVFLAAPSDTKVLKVSGGVISVAVGSGVGQAVTVAPNGDMYYSTQSGTAIRRVTPGGDNYLVVDTSALNGNYNIKGLAVGANGVGYFSANGQVSRFSPNGSYTSISSSFNDPSQLALEPSGSLLVADSAGEYIKRITDPAGSPTVTAAAGTGVGGGGIPQGPATATNTANPQGVAVDANGTIYLSDAAVRYVARILPAPPAAPLNVTSQRGDGQIEIDFDAASTNGGGPITGYQYSLDGTTNWTTLDVDSSGPQLAGTVTGLTNGTSYTIRIRATSATGEGDVATAPTATPSTTPDVPSGLVITPLPGSARLNFTAPDSGGRPLKLFKVKVNGGSAATLVTTPATPVPANAVTGTISGLVNGTEYSIVLYATNANGNGQATAPIKVTPADLPTAPALVTPFSVRGNAQATVTFTPVADPPTAPVIRYEATTDGGTTWSTVTGVTTTSGTSTGTVTGLTNGTPSTIALRAVNRIGGGPASGNTTVTPATTPNAPTAFSASVADSQSVLTFTAPPTGGDPIGSYQVNVNGGGWNTFTTSGSGPLNITVPNLVNGTSYAIEVRAVNTVGAGTTSGTQTVIPATVPDAPTGLTAVRGNAQATLTFVIPVSGHGRAITSYEWSTDDFTTPHTLTTSAVPMQPTMLTGTATGLTNGTAYTFKVRAVSTIGNSAASVASGSVTPATVPDAPTNLAATFGNGQAALTWTVPATGGSAITGYDYTIDNGSTWTPITTPGAGTATITGLNNGTAYIFKIRAVNDVSYGAASGPSSSITPATIPSTVSDLTATRANVSANISFTSPAPNGSTITHYQYLVDSGSWTTFSPSLSTFAGVTTATANVPGLTNGVSSAIQVRAQNSVGDGLGSNVVNITPATTASAPQNVIASHGNRQVDLVFTDPADNGTDPITGYQYNLNNGPDWSALTWTAGTLGDPNTGTIGNLTNGTAYTIKIRAVNGMGPGATATAIPTVTPSTVPAAPTGLTIASGDTTATLSFTAPSAGGRPILGYMVTIDGGSPVALTTTTTGPLTSGTLTGLTNGHEYSIVLYAYNANGDGPQTAVVKVTPARAPDQPTGLAAMGGNASATLTYTAPVVTGGAPITKYQYTTDNGAHFYDLGGSGALTGTALVSPLTNGQAYVFAVRAVNSAGPGAWSANASSITPATDASAPTALQASLDNGQSVLTFETPSDSGGFAIDHYEYKLDTGNWTTFATTLVPNTTQRTGTVPNLTNGTLYAIAVRAVTSFSNGTASAPVMVTPATVPGAPTGLTSIDGNQQVTLSFVPPASNGRVITKYQWTKDAGNSWTDFTAVPVPAVFPSIIDRASVTIATLTNGHQYTFAVRAVNDVGPGGSSGSSVVTPATIPGAPTNLATSLAGGQDDEQAVLTFDAPTVSGGSAVTGYQYRIGTGTWTSLTTTGTTSRTGTVPNLLNGTPYSIAVRALNGATDGGGVGPASDPVLVTPAAAPDAPASLTAVPGNGQATLSFLLPAGNGNTITSYEYTSDGGDHWTSVPRTPPVSIVSIVLPETITVTGLTNGHPYTFAVRAVNEAGTGEWSGDVNVTPATTAGAPVLTSGTVADQQTVLTFTAPVSNGGSTITGYKYSINNGSTWTAFSPAASGSPLTGTITGLTNGTAYSIKVQATNGAGDGAASNTVIVTPVGPAPPVVVVPPVVVPPVAVVPGAPSTPSAVAGLGSVTVSWSAGSPSTGTTGYTVTASPGGATCSTTTTSCVITGTPGTPYTFTVKAHSAVGDSPASAASAAATPTALVIPNTAPLDAPTTLTTPAGQPDELEPSDPITVTGGGFAGNTSADVYAYSTPIKLGTATTTSSGTLSLDVTIPASLEPGEHNIVATGVAPDGTQRTIRMPFTLVTGAAKAPATAPKNVAVVASASRTFTVTFDKATAVSPAKIIGYEFSISSGRHWKLLATTGKTRRTVLITGLANGKLYGVSVRAITSTGPGAMSVVIPMKAKRPMTQG